ncbi:hypothetical protein, partial [Paraburkholderia sp. EG304]|uniref:hypothetical protein n=1 Tax=Paraburkholderia sp. EG304 TaxID=3237015 RepID=UPI00397D8F3B
ETRTFVSFHRQRLLLHPVLPSLSTPLYNAPSSYAVDLISNALNWLRPVLHMFGPRQDGQISSDLRVKPPWCWQDLTGFLGLFCHRQCCIRRTPIQDKPAPFDRYMWGRAPRPPNICRLSGALPLLLG